MDELPFTCLTDIEFLRETGAWIYQCTSALNSKDLFADVLAGPNKLESCENEGISTESKYYDVKNTAKILKTGNKGFSLLHCNIRSLSKNLPLLNDILLMCKEMPSVIAISETKLSEDNLSNVAIQGYKFISKHSPTNAGGVGLYICPALYKKRLSAKYLIYAFRETSRPISSVFLNTTSRRCNGTLQLRLFNLWTVL